jgi:signal transduction histidine kinase
MRAKEGKAGLGTMPPRFIVRGGHGEQHYSVWDNEGKAVAVSDGRRCADLAMQDAFETADRLNCAMPASGTKLTTAMSAIRPFRGSVEIRIRDNGTGIPAEVRDKMFNPFFTTKPAGEGTGLGLSLSHDIIVKQHAGSIEVDTKPGQLTEFRAVLPRAAAAVGKSGGNG